MGEPSLLPPDYFDLPVDREDEQYKITAEICKDHECDLYELISALDDGRDPNDAVGQINQLVMNIRRKMENEHETDRRFRNHRRA